MKKLNFIPVWMMFAFILIQSNGQSQNLGIKDFDLQTDNSEFYWGPDTSQAPPSFETYGEILNNVFGSLDPMLQTDILTDRVAPISRKTEFNGISIKPKGTVDDFYRIYTEMEEAHVPYREHVSVFKLDSSIRHFHKENDIIPIGMLRYTYETLKLEAKKAGKVYWDGYTVTAQNGIAYEEILADHESFILCPLRDALDSDGFVKFKLSQDFVFTNMDEVPSSIEIDFDDGMGYQQVNFDEVIEVLYSYDGIKNIAYKVEYEDGSIRRGVSIIESREADPILDYDCGGGTTIFSHLNARDLPQLILPVTADEVIVNPKNNGSLDAQMGVYFGCGNSTCEIKKPFIIVTGYGPNTMFSPQRRLVGNVTEEILYSSINGIFGSDASSSQDPGQNNGTNLLYRLRNEGFDVIILYFENGVDFVQNHAALVTQCIETVNSMKAAAGSKHENVIMGQSMGGLSTRYALATWEQDRMDPETEFFQHHQCRLWISFEGEMQGATIPLGTQAATWYLTHMMPITLFYTLFGPAALPVGLVGTAIGHWGIYNELLNNPGAKSMLTYHYSFNGPYGSAQTIRHPFFIALQNELAELGYPQYPRRVAIADGSSVVQRPADLETDINSPNYGGECLMNISFLNPFTLSSLNMSMYTEKVLQTQKVFSANLKQFGIPIPGATYSVNKIYQRAESIAPGAYERFYRGYFLHFAQASILHAGSCAKPNYRLSFIPTTSVFDIQNDFSLDYNYNVSDVLFYRTFNEHDFLNRFGYPHNNILLASPEEVTPFHACYASAENEFHIQNPQREMANFILLETSSDYLELQNRTISGHQNEVYQAQFDARDSIYMGFSITDVTQDGDFVLESFTDVAFNSPMILLRDGVHIKQGARALIRGFNAKPDSCFLLINVNQRTAQYSKSDQVIPAEVKPEELETEIKLYPNPARDMFNIAVSDWWVGCTASLFDVTGRMLETRQINHSLEEWGLNSSYSGPVVVRFTKDQEVKHLKIIIQ